MVTDPQSHKHTNRQDRLQYTALLASAQCINCDKLSGMTIYIRDRVYSLNVKDNVDNGRKHRSNLNGMEGNTRDTCNALTHETFVILDGAQGVTGVVEHTDKLLHRPTAPDKMHRRQQHQSVR